MNLSAAFARDAVRLLGAAVCVDRPASARRMLDLAANDRLDAARPAHGWVCERNPDGSLWFTYGLRDQNGFELGGESRRDPPPDIDPATIPVIESGPGYDLAARVGSTRGLLAAYTPGQALNIGMLGRSQVVEGLGAARDPLLSELATIQRIVGDGFERPLRDAWFAAVPSRELGAVRAAVDRATDAFLVDGAVGGMARLLDAALAAAPTGSPSPSILAGGFAMHVASFRMDDPDEQLAILIMHLRKCMMPDLSIRMADLFLAQSRTAWHAGLDATDLVGCVSQMFRAAHAARTAHQIYADILRIAGDKAPSLWRKSRNVADEWFVRSSGSVRNAFQNLEGTLWARHRHSGVRAAAVGGVAQREARVDELVEMHWFYPRCWKAALLADPPTASTDESVLGPAYAAEYFRLAGYAV